MEKHAVEVLLTKIGKMPGSFWGYIGFTFIICQGNVVKSPQPGGLGDGQVRRLIPKGKTP